MSKTSYVYETLEKQTWGHSGTCESCGRFTRSGCLVLMGYIPGEGAETCIECFICVKRDIGRAYDTEYEYYSGMEGVNG